MVADILHSIVNIISLLLKYRAQIPLLLYSYFVHILLLYLPLGLNTNSKPFTKLMIIYLKSTTFILVVNLLLIELLVKCS